MNHYSAKTLLKCPDCNVDGGDGPRCPKHEKEFIEHEIARGRQRIKEIEEKADGPND